MQLRRSVFQSVRQRDPISIRIAERYCCLGWTSTSCSSESSGSCDDNSSSVARINPTESHFCATRSLRSHPVCRAWIIASPVGNTLARAGCPPPHGEMCGRNSWHCCSARQIVGPILMGSGTIRPGNHGDAHRHKAGPSAGGSSAVASFVVRGANARGHSSDGGGSELIRRS